ncbi:MAG: hypothetical protein ABI822_34135, partial [Bryobacteraceae bacterium]
GNPAEDIRPIPGMMIGATWSNKGTILFGTESSAILRVDAANAEPVPVTVRDITTERVHIFPVFLPDGKHFLYSRVLSDPNKTGVYLGAVDAKPEEQSLTRLIATSFAPQFALSSDGNGVILFQRDKTLWGQKFDTSRLQMLGEPAVLAERLGNTRAYGFFAASRDVLIHRSGTADMGQLTWMNRRGQRLGTLGEAADHYDFRGCISPDGSKIALTRGGSESTDIWVHDLSRDVIQRLTFEPSIDQAPIWSPNGKNLVFSSSRNGRFDLYQVSSHGGGGPELLYASRENKFASSWSADGRFILFSTENRDGIWVLPLESTGKRTPVSILRSPGNERSAVFSPDSRWIGYVSNESGQPEVYVQRFSFAVPGSPGPKVLISRGGGMSPRWRADGKEIFYRAPDGKLMAVPFTAEPALQAGVPKPLFKTGWLWEATGDGNRFLVDVPVEHGVPPFTVVLNWQTGLKH